MNRAKKPRYSIKTESADEPSEDNDVIFSADQECEVVHIEEFCVEELIVEDYIVSEEEYENPIPTVFDTEPAIQQIPLKIWTRILKFLPLQDRKSAKLVCSVWYKAYNDESILNEEKIVCFNVYPLTKMLTTIMNSKLQILNLEFREINFRNYPALFWKKCGPKIRSLSLIDCSYKPETIEKMLQNCKDLNQLCWTYSRNYKLKPPTPSLISVHILENLISKNFVVGSVTTLEICSSNPRINESITDFTIYGLFKLFPNITEFTLHCDFLDNDFTSLQELGKLLQSNFSKERFTLGVIPGIISGKSDIIEKLDLELRPRKFSFLAWEMIVQTWIPLRLKDITVDLCGGQDTKVIDFLLSLQTLESFKCYVNETPTSEFLAQLLDNNRNLRHLHVELNECSDSIALKVSYELLYKFTESCLETLSIVNAILDANIHTAYDLPFNDTIHTVKFYGFVQEEVQIFFVQKLRNLRCLEFHPRDSEDEFLQSLWKHHTKLRSLKINSMDKDFCTDEGLIGKNCDSPVFENSESYSIRRLEKLEHLDIVIQETDSVLTKAVFSEFVFSNLRYLKIMILQYSLSSSDINSVFVESLKNMPALEGLYLVLNNEPLYYESWIEICKNLKRLRYIYVDDSDGFGLEDKFHEAQYKEFFAMCPALRAIEHCQDDESPVDRWYYDIFQSKPVKKTDDRTYYVFAGKINSISVDWMEC